MRLAFNEVILINVPRKNFSRTVSLEMEGARDSILDITECEVSSDGNLGTTSRKITEIMGLCELS